MCLSFPQKCRFCRMILFLCTVSLLFKAQLFAIATKLFGSLMGYLKRGSMCSDETLPKQGDAARMCMRVCVCVCTSACVCVCVHELYLLNLLASELTGSAKGGWSVLNRDVSSLFQLLRGLFTDSSQAAPSAP